MERVTPTDLLPKNIPDANGFKDYVESLGISSNHHVMVYDRSPAGFFASTRLWWLFRVEKYSFFYFNF